MNLTGIAPVSGAEFAALMAPLAPFSDLIAVGCSGGPDSLALTRLAESWARARGGTLLALIVEHGLRAESAAEAANLAQALTAAGIAVRVLPLGLSPGAGMQDRARRARRAALLAACRESGAPHLLLGHHADDQAETVLFRALRGSGAPGLAGMAPLTVAPEALILRPLLAIPKARLAVTLEGWAIAPAQDPSNANPRFARARLRASGDIAAAALAAEGFARRRIRLARRIAERLADSVRLLPEGCAAIASDRLGQDVIARRLMAALIRAVGGHEHAPAETAVAALLARGSGTLGGTLWRGGWLVREGSEGPDPRFRLPVSPGLTVGSLGPDAASVRGRMRHLPAAALASLPALRRSADGMLVAAPHLAYLEPEMAVSFPPVFAPPGGPVTECHLSG